MEVTQFNKIEVDVIGAGGLARELLSWINNDKNSNLIVKGFWDDNLDALVPYKMKHNVFGNISSFKSGNVLIGIMSPQVKQKLLEEFTANSSINLLRFIHSSVIVGERTNIGKGVVLFPNVIISCDVNIGDGTFINLGSQIGHDVTIGRNVSIMPNVDIGGGCVMGDNVFIGSGATILPGVKIEGNTRIGAGSVVLKTIKKEGTYFGNPAKKIF
ncbi:acetyltransferase [Sphingobacterium siyangense]|uniref:Sugar O-acyltransferase (Sialic acid O-acetyltransferase NeuD family) n=1 Tax=Sphingobacterium siyangense TaxID=459529 RepID=A0A562MK90_9SPHI|nr:acetyltransferase [Sphingobacterium siyangense]TWI19971.1 sugar O-acyltransferase (sialic acid O-acetyltransferase NeuD family) [Sphingobacterium siyangense]